MSVLQLAVPGCIAVAGSVTLVILKYKNQKEDRISEFVYIFFTKYKRAGVTLELIIPAGINQLSDNKEIEEAFKRLLEHLGFHPLRNWDNEIKTIGYKIFFDFALNANYEISEDNVQEVIDAYYYGMN